MCFEIGQKRCEAVGLHRVEDPVVDTCKGLAETVEIVLETASAIKVQRSADFAGQILYVSPAKAQAVGGVAQVVSLPPIGHKRGIAS